MFKDILSHCTGGRVAGHGVLRDVRSVRLGDAHLYPEGNILGTILVNLGKERVSVRPRQLLQGGETQTQQGKGSITSLTHLESDVTVGVNHRAIGVDHLKPIFTGDLIVKNI